MSTLFKEKCEEKMKKYAKIVHKINRGVLWGTPLFTVFYALVITRSMVSGS